jgi:hypothetical protein
MVELLYCDSLSYPYTLSRSLIIWGSRPKRGDAESVRGRRPRPRYRLFLFKLCVCVCVSLGLLSSDPSCEQLRVFKFECDH